MKQIGIRLADGSFYPIMEDGQKCSKTLGLTTVKDNQTRVIVDVYRSQTGTMEDAEYIDSLQIENLVEHPNGTVDINLDIGLDENGKLKAAMIDPETGNTSSADVTLVSRTLEERLEPTNYEISMSDLEKQSDTDSNEEQKDSVNEDTNVAGAALAGAAVGAVAGGIIVNELNKDSEQNEQTQTASENAKAETDFEDLPDLEETSFSDSATIENADEESKISDDFQTSLPEQNEQSFEENSEDFFDLGDTIVEEPVVSDDVTSVQEEAEKTVDATQGDSSISDDISFEEPAEDSVLEENVSSEDSFELPNFDDEVQDSLETEISVPKQELENSTSEAADTKEDVQEPTSPATEISEQPLIDEEPHLDDTVVSENQDSQTAQENSLDGFDLPDFNLPEENEENSESETSNSLSDDDFLKTIDSDSNSLKETEPIFNNDLVNDNTPSNGINFNGLYDKETEQGTSSVSSDDEVSESVRKKTKTPVIICLVCAIICLICAALVLFVVPSKFNLLGKKNSNSEPKEVAPVLEEVVPSKQEEQKEVEPTPIEAKEDEIVVAQEPEEVIPEPPAPPVEKPKDITYKIKWGDTLWDIADAYYKNPWRYKYIARYNGIKNPDYIISGTTITIPAN